MLNDLLSVSAAVVIDIVFFVLILGGILLGVWRGFAKSICKLAGTIFSLIIAVTFCIAFANVLADWGLTTAISDGVKNSTVGWWLTVAISFVALIVIVRLGAWGFGTLAKALVHKSKTLGRVDRVLGGLLGLIEIFCGILFLLAVFNWIPSDGLHEFIGNSTVVGALFRSNWFVTIMSNLAF